MDLAVALRHPIHDCFDVAAAQLHDSRLITADRRLAGKLAAHPALAGRVTVLGPDAPSAWRGATLGPPDLGPPIGLPSVAQRADVANRLVEVLALL